ncbi:PKD domain-containing protein [Salinibacter sp. 10B]|uniref:OmpA family protein n=1 Tax=Salinibacter sp. 10B TaxID=1923971 RepID=UPI002157F876|nr:PKD domain-containing protein [Salinibacter sp. 10B]
MNARQYSSLWLPILLLFGGLFLAGCGATAPVVNSINTPDTLETGESGNFRASIENEEDADEPLTYTWDYGDGSTGSGLNTSKAYNSTGQYTVLFSASNEGGADSSRAMVTVVRPPQPAQITSINANPNPVDAGNQVNFSSNVQGDSPIDYSWSFGDGNSGSGSSPSHTFESAGQYTVQLEASNNVGSDSRSVTVRVNRDLPEICTTVSEFNSAFFGRNSSTLTDEARKSLQENTDLLSQCPNLSVRIEGFAAPGERNAQSLSEDRAQAVADFYSGNGVQSSRITMSGEGEVSGVTTKKGGTREYRRADSIPQR